MSRWAPDLGWTAHRPRSTRLGKVVVAGGSVLIILSVITDNRALLLLGALALGARIAAWLTWPSCVPGTRICLDSAARCQLGDRPGFTLHLHNDSGRWTPRAALRVESERLAPVAIDVPCLAPYSAAILEGARVTLGRGVVDTHDVTLEWTDWMGLRRSSVSASLVARKQLIIQPRVDQSTARQSLAAVGDDGSTESARSGAEPHSLREWRPGEPTRHVHWRGSARAGSLVVVEHAPPRGTGFVLLVVGDGSTRMAESTVTEFASRALAAARGGHPVTLGGSQAGLSPVVARTPNDILDWCARIDVPVTPSLELMETFVRDCAPESTVCVAVAGSVPDQWWLEVAATALVRRVACVRLDLTDPVGSIERVGEVR